MPVQGFWQRVRRALTGEEGEVATMDYLERTGVFAGLPSRIAMILRRRGLHTRALVAAWHRDELRHRSATRGIGPKSMATIAAWLGADMEGQGDEPG